MEQMVISLRLPAALGVKLTSRAEEHYRSRNAEIVAILSAACGIAEDLPDEVTVRPIETVELPEPGEVTSAVTPRTPTAKADLRGEGPPCTHPKNRRENLGYSVKCGVCGEVLR